MPSKTQFIVYSTLALLILVGNYLISGPIFEGYLYSEYFRNQGFLQSIPNTLGRPLALIPNILIEYLFESSKLGYFLVSSFLVVARGCTIYLIRRCLGAYTLPVAILVMALPLWQAVLNERFIAAQLSVNFSLLALCFYVQNSFNKKPVIVFLFLAILTYPPVALVLPIAIFIVNLLNSSFRKQTTLEYLKLSWVLIPLVLYLSWLTLLKLLGLDSYDTRSGGFPTFAAVNNLMHTLLFDNLGFSLLLLFFPLVIFRLFHTKLSIFYGLLSISLIYLSPLTYSQVAIHLNDPERVFFCVSLTSLFTSIILICTNVEKSFNLDKFQLILSSYIAMGLISLTLIVFQWLPIQISNRDLLQQIEIQLQKYPSTKSIIIQDFSGYLGDVRTYYGSSSLENILKEGNSLLAAIRLNHPDFVSAIICTPKEITRIHPAAEVFPLPTTRGCHSDMDEADLNLRLNSFKPIKLSIVSD